MFNESQKQIKAALVQLKLLELAMYSEECVQQIMLAAEVDTDTVASAGSEVIKILSKHFDERDGAAMLVCLVKTLQFAIDNIDVEIKAKEDIKSTEECPKGATKQ